MLHEPPRAFVLGDVNVDISLAVDEYPSEGGDAQAHSRILGSGGGGLNAAVALRSLGVDVSLVGCVGTDPLSEIVMHTATRRGVDLSRLQRSEAVPTGTCVLITSPGGERTLLSHRGANAQLSGECVDGAAVRQARLLLVFGYALLSSPQRESTLAALERAREHGCVTAMDVGLAVARRAPAILGNLRLLDLVLMNEQELLVLTSCTSPSSDVGEALEVLFAHGARAVVVKQGSRGCLFANVREQARFGGQAVRAVDTTACGDAFSAAFSWMWASESDVAECARVANRMGAMTACRRGAAESVPSAAQFADATSDIELAVG